MKSLSTYIYEKLRINKNYTFDGNRLYDTFVDTIKNNFKINNKYKYDTVSAESVKYEIIDLFDGKKALNEIEDNIEDIMDLFKMYNENNYVQFYYTDEWIYDYKGGTFFSIVEEQCEYIFGDMEDGLLYITNYFSDYCVMGVVMNQMDVMWIVEK